jgi:hypothetical protein
MSHPRFPRDCLRLLAAIGCLFPGGILVALAEGMTPEARCGSAVTNGAAVEAVDRSLKIVSETKDQLEREFERPL